ncbi:hypothetical protein Tco_0861480 [Tanacetum coccineum]|uniref:Uncharacterized protein n=1 Tax=Tanacetum coccineum TaxID=301880 RepID=A0ABQ5BIQ3_9ASTR
MHAQTNEKINSLVAKIEKLNAELKGKIQSTTIDAVKPRVLAHGKYAMDVDPIPPPQRNNRDTHIVLAPGKYAMDVDPIPPPQRNNMDTHIAFLKHLKDNVEILREIVEEGSIANPLDSAL